MTTQTNSPVATEFRPLSAWTTQHGNAECVTVRGNREMLAAEMARLHPAMTAGAVKDAVRFSFYSGY